MRSIPYSILATARLVIAAPGMDAEQVATVPVSNEYVLRAWEIDDGLPSNTVSGVTQTPDGYRWIATPDGLARFDGVRFTSYLNDTVPGEAAPDGKGGNGQWLPVTATVPFRVHTAWWETGWFRGLAWLLGASAPGWTVRPGLASVFISAAFVDSPAGC